MHTRTLTLLSLVSGLLLGLPWSISPVFFVIFIAWVPLLMVERDLHHHANPYIVFNYALLGFLFWNIIGTWWIARAQFVGAACIILANSLLQALVFWLASRIRTFLGLPLLFPWLIIWLGYEHFHLNWDLAWPWLNLGNALATVPELIQWYEYTGVRGGTLWIILANFAALKLLDSTRQKDRTAVMRVGTATVVLFLVPLLVSHYILRNLSEKGDAVEIALVQPNLDPYSEKFDPDNYARHVANFFETADALVDERTDYLIGPETLVVDQIDENNPQTSIYYRNLLEFRKNYPNLNIILGIHSFQKLENEQIPPGSRFDQAENFYYEAFNTALFLPSGPSPIPQYYHKTKLVPLFERVPFVQYLSFLGSFALELGGYSGTYSLRQERRVFISTDGSTAILPIVCYESIFGPYCSRILPAKKGFICMITNDGWWKNTPGYRHHFDFSPLRAIENRMDFVRAANNGISAIIDFKGQVIARTPWWKSSTLNGRVHLRQGQTFFARHGDYLGRLSLIFAGIMVLFAVISFGLRRDRK